MFGNSFVTEMGHYLSNHFWVHDCNRQVLLRNGLPIDTTELVHLGEQFEFYLRCECVRSLAIDIDFDRESKLFDRVAQVLVADIVAKEIVVVSQRHISSAYRHTIAVCHIESKDRFGFRFVDIEECRD